jgi:hypothetical protein
LVRPDLTPKPTYHVLADTVPLIAQTQFVDRLSTGDDHLWVLRFAAGQAGCWALWSADDKDRQVILETKSFDRPPRSNSREVSHARRHGAGAIGQEDEKLAHRIECRSSSDTVPS